VSVSEKSNKEQMIIEAAQKRFGMLGIEKTSMQEIADDLKLSKASLYYYFPDKESLYKAVIEKEQNEFVKMITEKVLSINEPDKLLREYVNARLSYFRSLLNLSRLRLDAYSDLRPVFKETIIAFKEKEKEIVKKILNDGIKKGIFILEDSDSTASLFLNLLKGLRISVVNDKKTMFIEQEEYDKLLSDTVAFTDIFIKGIKNK
jgi:TetR/AcrR family transcriptional regulator